MHLSINSHNPIEYVFVNTGIVFIGIFCALKLAHLARSQDARIKDNRRNDSIIYRVLIKFEDIAVLLITSE